MSVDQRKRLTRTQEGNVKTYLEYGKVSIGTLEIPRVFFEKLFRVKDPPCEASGLDFREVDVPSAHLLVVLV